MKSTSTLTQTLRPRTGARGRPSDRYVNVAGVRTRYLEDGENHRGVPLLVVHGYNGSSDYWYPYFLPLLAEERRVIALDLPGCGLSGKLPSHTTETYAEFLVGFLDALGIDKADVMGHSMGGLLALATTARYPERVRKLVLIDSAGLPEMARPHWRVPFRAATDSSARLWRLYPTFVKTGLRARTAREGLDVIRKYSVRQDLRQIHAPVLILWGSRDRLVPIEHGAFMAKHIPGARLAVVRGAGHMPFYERPEECKRLVLGFLREEVGSRAAEDDNSHSEQGVLNRHG
jgi:pimeloyl-ACP methyl ester carboxylesterase